MTTSTCIFALFAFPAIVMAFGQASSDTDGISPICSKARSNSGYPRIPIECCNNRAKCPIFILPGQTKYGLTNPDMEWSRRACSCDDEFFQCVTKGLSPKEIRIAQHPFRGEICMTQTGVRTIGKNRTPVYEFITFIPTNVYTRFLNRA